MQASVTRVNRTYYSDLNLVFHCKVSQENQGSFDLCTIVHNWLRCITQSLHFALKHQDIDYCQRQAIFIGRSYITTAGRSFQIMLCVCSSAESKCLYRRMQPWRPLGLAGGQVLAWASFWLHLALVRGLDATAPASPA